MKPIAVMGAAAAALVGALIWTLVCSLTRLEIGWVAWGVGCLVGIGAVALGGRGKQMAVTCALLAAAGIFLGKVLTVKTALAEGIESAGKTMLTVETYEEWKKFAEEIASVDDAKHVEYAIARGFSPPPEDPAHGAGAKQLELFKTNVEPILRGLHEERWDYERWRAEMLAVVTRCAREECSIAGMTFRNLSAIDVIFFLLGISTAFRIVASRPEAKPESAGGPSAQRAIEAPPRQRQG
jgi:hypothetical protein